MAPTNSKFFTYSKNLNGVPSAPTPVKIKIANSTTLKVGQMARVNTGGFVVPAGVGNPILGRVVGFVDNDGSPVNAFGYIGQAGMSLSGDDTVITASDNQTRNVAVFAEVEADTEAILLKNTASAALSQSNLLQMFDLVSTSDQVDQATASDTSGQMQLIELDADNTSIGYFRVAESQLVQQLGNSTPAVVA